ncbi:hypothetical protein K2F54_12245, partial [Cryobacterium sp. 1639]|uniref:hypothetical protein n=1 Tax=Cryobacterium inferilacus TaxID=2866629 RepID=UPI001C72DE2C
VRVNARTHNSRLHIHLTADHTVLSATSTQALARTYRVALAALTVHGDNLSAPRKTLSDADAMDLDVGDLDELNALFGG